MPTVNFYIDGFNLYYGSLRNRWPEFKWLNLQSFCENLAPEHTVKRVRYFTSRTKPTPRDPGVAQRQQIFLRALATLPKVYIHYGLFVTRDVRMPLANNISKDDPIIVTVTRTEEKRTDVNLATTLLLDCFNNDSDTVVVISNDSDLIAPVSAVHQQLRKPIGVMNPQPRSKRSTALAQVASWSYETINKRYFADNQLPSKMRDDKGEFNKPSSW